MVNRYRFLFLSIARKKEAKKERPSCMPLNKKKTAKREMP
jgi:hypothetical protein